MSTHLWLQPERAEVEENLCTGLRIVFLGFFLQGGEENRVIQALNFFREEEGKRLKKGGILLFLSCP